MNRFSSYARFGWDVPTLESGKPAGKYSQVDSQKFADVKAIAADFGIGYDIVGIGFDMIHDAATQGLSLEAVYNELAPGFVENDDINNLNNAYKFAKDWLARKGSIPDKYKITNTFSYGKKSLIAGLDSKTIMIGGAALAGLLFLMKRKRR